MAFDVDRPYQLGPRVALRPERFGALAYDYDSRRLAFLKAPQLVSAILALAGCPTARDALRLAGVPEEQWPLYERALADLERSGIIHERCVAEEVRDVG